MVLSLQLYFAKESVFYYFAAICYFMQSVSLTSYTAHNAWTSVMEMTFTLFLLVCLFCSCEAAGGINIVASWCYCDDCYDDVNNSVIIDYGCACPCLSQSSSLNCMACARRSNDANSQEINWTRNETIANAAKRIY